MSTILTGLHLAMCMSDDVSTQNEYTVRWSIRKDESGVHSFVVFKDASGGINISRQSDGSGSSPIGLKDGTLEEWQHATIEGWFRQDTIVVHSCNECRHRLVCLIEPQVAKTFESK